MQWRRRAWHELYHCRPRAGCQFRGSAYEFGRQTAGNVEGFASLRRENWRTPDFVAVVGVCNDPVSTESSLINRDNTGNLDPESTKSTGLSGITA